MAGQTNISPIYLAGEIEAALGHVDGNPRAAKALLRGLLRELQPEVDRASAAIDAGGGE